MRQFRVLIAALSCLLGGCVGGGLPPSVWPPPDFSLEVEEMTLDAGFSHTVRRFRVDASGVAVYGTSSSPLIDSDSRISLPVFDRLCVYRLEPNAVRLLARRLHRLRITEVKPAVYRGRMLDEGMVIKWRAFGNVLPLPSSGRLRGQMADIVAVISSFLPPGESFQTPLDGRQIVPILRGVPEPATGTSPALAQMQKLLAVRPDDETLLLDTFALACADRRRDVARSLLDQWIEWRRAEAQRSPFTDPGGAPRLRVQDLRGFLPPE